MRKIDKERFVINLRYVRNLKGLSQGLAAKKLGMGQGTYSQYESTRIMFPSAQVIVNMCDLYKVTFEQLFFSEDIAKDIAQPKPSTSLAYLVRKVIREELEIIRR